MLYWCRIDTQGCVRQAYSTSPFPRTLPPLEGQLAVFRLTVALPAKTKKRSDYRNRIDITRIRRDFWNTCDWFCVRVLGPLVVREGELCARAIAAWSSANNLWQRRASGVTFVNLASKGDGNFPGFTTMVIELCAATVQYHERFAQTGTGWALRELSRAEPEGVIACVEAHVQHFSPEGLRYVIGKLPADTKGRMLAQHKARLQEPRAADRDGGTC